MESIIEGKVKDMVDSNDNQAWNLSAHLLPQETLSHIASSYLRSIFDPGWSLILGALRIGGLIFLFGVQFLAWCAGSCGRAGMALYLMVPTVLPITLFSLVWPGLGVMSMVEKAAGGGLLRDENGTWILGYGRCFGERSVVQAEA
ncbi:hypothetical protein GOBAR_DD09539 [Gossypium barbadense]|nr:hypothetical protein GOBAR_DD09539 [Gossypium barbadense]